MILDIPLWTFEPNWESNVTESQEWLTNIFTSPDGSEQRRQLRRAPRILYEFANLSEGRDLAFLNNALSAHLSEDWYLPLWFDVRISSEATSIGATAILWSPTGTNGISAGAVVYIVGPDPLFYELAEVSSSDSYGLSFVSALTRAWPAGTRIYPLSVARLTDPPQLSKKTDRLVTTQVKFSRLDPLPDWGTPSSAFLPDTYLGKPVLTREPEDGSREITFDLDRVVELLDNQTATPRQKDVAKRSFSVQQHPFRLVGRDEHANFDSMMKILRGRTHPIWIPTFMSDFELAVTILSGDDIIVVAGAGFTRPDGPGEDRRHIMIQTGSAVFYRNIESSSVAFDGSELLTLDSPIPATVEPYEVVRICFIALCRLNHDSIQISHATDVEGMSNVLLSFRAAPDTRAPANPLFG